MTSPWPRTRVTERLGLLHPIVLGPFGGGLSTTALTALVSDAGGLGSFGAQTSTPDEITATVDELRGLTRGPFAVNLWVSTHDEPEEAMTRERFDAAADRLRPLYDEFEVDPPPYPDRFSASFEEQVEALIAARPPAFSFVYGVPSEDVLRACRDRGIVTLGTAITADEAVALDAAGVDVIVASGFEAGGHRVAFLAEPEQSLVGTLALVPVVVEAVRAPVVAAGGIADARGVAAALALGAGAAQIGTAFLATAESGASPEHQRLLLEPPRQPTRLTRAFTGRLARGIPNRIMDDPLVAPGRIAPFPYQSYLLRPVFDAARRDGRTDAVALWSGQAAALLTHRRAADLLAALVAGA